MLQKIGDKFYDEIDSKVYTDNIAGQLHKLQQTLAFMDKNRQVVVDQINTMISNLSVIQNVDVQKVTVGDKSLTDLGIDAIIQPAPAEDVKL